MWKHDQYEHKNMPFGVTCMLPAVGSSLGHHNWHLCGQPLPSCFQKVIRADAVQNVDLCTISRYIWDFVGTFHGFAVYLSVFIGSVLQPKKTKKHKTCLINDWPCRFPNSMWNRRFHYSACLVSVYLAYHPPHHKGKKKQKTNKIPYGHHFVHHWK